MCKCKTEVAHSIAIGMLYMLCGTFSGLGGILIGVASELGEQESEAGASGMGTAGIMCFIACAGFLGLALSAQAMYANMYEKKDGADVSPV